MGASCPEDVPGMKHSDPDVGGENVLVTGGKKESVNNPQPALVIDRSDQQVNRI